MSIGGNGLHESYLEPGRERIAYQKKRAVRAVPVVRIDIHESDFYHTISVTADSRVFYLDHVLIGFLKRGCFVGSRWTYRVVSMAGVRKVKRYIEGRL